MATKTQQNQRWSGIRNQSMRRSATTADTPRFDGVSRLPSTPVAWYPESSGGLEFAQRLMGSTAFLEQMLRTEAGEQYKKARARAMRGEFTLDDSGMFTFQKEQQRAISEVEGALSGMDAVNALSMQAAELEQELASSDLTPAQKVAAYTSRMRQLAYQTFEGNTADSDYVIAKGTEIHRYLEGATTRYREQAIDNQLSQERANIATLFRSRVNHLGSELTAAEKAQAIQGAIQEYSVNMKRAAGVDASLTPGALKELARELVSSGNREVLERLQDSPVGETGATMATLGLITPAMLEEADRAHLSQLQRRERERALKSTAAVEKYTASFGGFDTALLDLGRLSGEEKLSRARELSGEFSSMIRQINADSGLSEESRQSLRNMLSRFQTMASNGGMTRPLEPEETAALRNMLDSNDISGLTRFFRDNPDVEPGVFKSYRDMAFTVNRSEREELASRKEWSDWLVLSSDLGGDDPMQSAREKQDAARQELYLFYLEEKNTNKEAGETAWREAAGKRFRAKYRELTRQEAVTQQAMADYQRKLRDPVSDFATLSDFPSTAAQAGEMDYLQLRENLLSNPSLSEGAKRRLQRLLPEEPARAGEISGVWNALLKGSDWRKMEGAVRAAGKFYDDFTPVADCSVVVRKPDGGLLFKPVGALSAEDGANQVTSPIANNMRYLREDGTVGRITEIEDEEQLISILSNARQLTEPLPPPDWTDIPALREGPYGEMTVLTNGVFGPRTKKIKELLTPSVWRPAASLFGSGWPTSELLSPVPLELMTIQELNDALGWQ